MSDRDRPIHPHTTSDAEGSGVLTAGTHTGAPYHTDNPASGGPGSGSAALGAHSKDAHGKNTQSRETHGTGHTPSGDAHGLAAQAREGLERAGETVRETAAATRDTLAHHGTRAAEQARHMMHDQPLMTLAFTAIAGFALGVMVAGRR
jgi:ElaB/YqjD/DUF883 family membrane-anchored ribosome-binding protein